jgi:glycosyltransferase involved in cell wall biosynthesis
MTQRTDLCPSSPAMDTRSDLARLADAAPQLFERYQGAAKALRVCVVSTARAKMLGAGDWRQAERTVAALRRLGLQVEHAILEPSPSTLPSGYDVYHVVPPLPSSNAAQAVCRLVTAPAVTSTVYWDSWRHRVLATEGALHRFGGVGRYLGRRLSVALATTAAWPVLRGFIPAAARRFEPFRVLLPNSFSEARVLRRSHAIEPGQLVRPIPNGVDTPPDWARSLHPPTDVPADYVVCPAVFAPRKNQLGLIRALRTTGIPIVFMGGPLPTPECHTYYERCRRAAGREHIFVGAVEFQSRRYYEILRHARLCVLASSCETPGLAALEASALGVRVAITREGSTTEYFEDGIFISPLKRTEMRNTLVQAYQSRRPQEGGDVLSHRFSWDNAARLTALAYLEALGDTKVQRATRRILTTPDSQAKENAD